MPGRGAGSEVEDRVEDARDPALLARLVDLALILREEREVGELRREDGVAGGNVLEAAVAGEYGARELAVLVNGLAGLEEDDAVGLEVEDLGLDSHGELVVALV